MIDANGNRIVPKNDKPDPEFLLKEINFFMKFFQEEANCVRALLIARKVVSFLKVSNRVDDIIATLGKLEDYSEKTRNEYFVWELIYARRELANKENNTPEGLMARAKHRHISTNHFGTLVRIKPSVFNRCAEVIELVTLSRYYKDAKDTAFANSILDKAQELYEKIEETNTEKYYDAGEYLYLDMIKNSERIAKNSHDKFQALLKLAHCSRGLYMINHNKFSVKLVALAYSDSSYYDEFCFADVKENIEQEIKWLEAEINAGHNELKDALNLIKNVVAKFGT